MHEEEPARPIDEELDEDIEDHRGETLGLEVCVGECRVSKGVEK